MASPFHTFMLDVDRWLLRLSGAIASADLPDYNYHDSYCAGETPQAVALDVLRREGWEEQLTLYEGAEPPRIVRAGEVQRARELHRYLQSERGGASG